MAPVVKRNRVVTTSLPERHSSAGGTGGTSASGGGKWAQRGRPDAVERLLRRDLLHQSSITTGSLVGDGPRVPAAWDSGRAYRGSRWDVRVGHARATAARSRVPARPAQQNLEDFVEADRQTNSLSMHPEDARAARLVDGALADVTTDTATVRVPEKMLPELMPRTVALSPPDGPDRIGSSAFPAWRNSRGSW